MNRLAISILVFLTLNVSMLAQDINTEFATKMNQTFSQMEKNRIPYGLLKDFAFEFTELSAYSGVLTDSNYVTPVALKQIYNTLLTARIHSNASQFILPDEYETRWENNRTKKVITLSGLFYNYSRFRNDALTAGKLSVINNQFRDKYVNGIWQNPYESKLVFAMAPSVRTYKGYNFSIKLPSNLWLTNSSISIQFIQIDANDGLGYRTINFNQSIAVAYNSEGLKHWKYKIKFTNGQYFYSQSKINIKKGFTTIPYSSIKQ